MKTSTITKTAGVLALLCSSASMAFSVTVTPSTLTPTVGQTFNVLLTGDVGLASAATISVAFDSSVLQWNGPGPGNCVGTLPASGPMVGGFCVKNTAYTSGSTFDLSLGTVPAEDTAPYDLFTFSFTALAGGPANLVFSDDGGNLTGWFNAQADPIAVDYNNASVTVQGAVIPLPAAAWLIAPAVLAAGRFSRRRKVA